MNPIAIFISFIVTIFGIAYPILFQVASRLDEKYSSIVINELFNKEKVQRFFKFTLFLSIVFTGIYILKLPPLFDFGVFHTLIENSSKIFLGISTFLLIIAFFLFVEKILTYNSPSRFLKYLINRNEKVKDNKSSYIEAITDLLLNSIRLQNRTMAITISDYLYSVYKKERIPNESQTIEYPVSLYDLIYKATEELAIMNSPKLSFLEYRTVGGLWLFGETGENIISEKTYSWIWRNLLLAIKYDRDDMVMYYWENAHNNFSMNLNKIEPKHSEEDYQIIVNSKEIEMRDFERKRFLEFHFALGGLLLYKKKYNIINRIFRYTTSIPPKYELLPDTMGEVFQKYIEFRDPHEQNHIWIANKYQFPDIEGLNADYIIKNWITKYVSLLFLRQYSIHPHLIIQKPLKLPSIPNTQSEKKIWLNNIDYFKKQVNEIMTQTELLSACRLDFITNDWLKREKKPSPVDLIDKYKKQIEEGFQKTEIEQPLSKQKVENFEKTSKRIVNEGFKIFEKININEEIPSDYNKWFVNGIRTVVDKSAFSDDQEADYSSFESFFAESISDKLQKGVSETFYYAKSFEYLLKPEEIFKSIDRLQINKDYVIISFRQNFDWLKRFAEEGTLTNNSYKGIEIISFDNCDYKLVGNSFFILKKSDLPNIIPNPVKKETIKKLSLKSYDSDTQLFGSVINLNESKKLLEELQPFHMEKDLRKYVLVTLAINTEIRWKDNINSIMIKTYSKYREQGLPNKLNDIKKIR